MLLTSSNIECYKMLLNAPLPPTWSWSSLQKYNSTLIYITCFPSFLVLSFPSIIRLDVLSKHAFLSRAKTGKTGIVRYTNRTSFPLSLHHSSREMQFRVQATYLTLAPQHHLQNVPPTSALQQRRPNILPSPTSIVNAPRALHGIP